VVAKNVDRAVGVAYDGRHIYWTDLVSEEEAILRSNEDGSNVEVVVNAGMLKLQTIYWLHKLFATLIALQKKWSGLRTISVHWTQQ
jgi:hypothetical protein